MPKEVTAELLQFLTPFPADVQERVLWLHDFVWERYPDANLLMYDNYNALALSWSITEKLGQVFCGVAIYRSNLNVMFGFYLGAELNDPEKRLLGNGNQFRYLTVPSIDGFPASYAEKLMSESWYIASTKVKNPKDIVNGKVIVKMVMSKKRETKAKTA